MTPRDSATGWRGTLAWMAALFLLAAGLRVGWVMYRWGPPGQAELTSYPDEDAYLLSARSLAAGAGLIDEFGYRATYMPGYPAFLAMFEGLARPMLWARIVQALLAACVAPATFVLARRFLQGAAKAAAEGGRDARPPVVSSSPPGGWASCPPSGPDSRCAPAEPTLSCCTLAPVLAGLAAAADPFLVFFSGLLLTEALFAAVLAIAWVFILRIERRSIVDTLLGPVFMWAAVMLRPSAAALVLGGPFVIAVLGRFHRPALGRAVMIPLLVMAGLVPWALRNVTAIGEWRWLTTRGGISLYDGLQPGATGASDLAHTKTMRAAKGLPELDWDEHFRNAAWDAALANPAEVLRLAGRKFLRTWSLTPNVEGYRAGAAARLSAVWMSVMLVLAAVGWWRVRRRIVSWLMLLLPVAVFTFLHMIYVGSVRYRVPLMPFVMVLSAMGAASILTAIWAKMTSRAPS